MYFSPVIYVIDDSEIDCMVISRLLSRAFANIKLEIFHSADEALEVIKRTETSADLILLDINMPAKNGWDFLDEYKFLENQKFGQTKVIIFTSSIHPDDPLKASKYDMVVGFIVKPIKQKDIEEKISIFLNQY